MSLAVLKQLGYMLVIAAMSFVFSRRNKFGQVQSAYASRLLLYFVNPCLILHSFITPYSTERAQGLALSAAVSLAIHLTFTAIAILARPKHRIGYAPNHNGASAGRGETQSAQNILASLDRVGVVFTNCGFIGIPLINGVLGGEAVFYLMGYIAVFNVYLWIYGAHEVGEKVNIKKLLTNPNVLAVIAGIALFCLPTIPSEWRKPLTYIADANTPLSMILLGMLFAQYTNTRQSGRNGAHIARRVVLAGVLRMAVLSAAAVAITAAVWRFVPHTDMTHIVLMVCCIAALCPVGMSVSSMSCVFYGGADAGGISPAAYSSLLVLSTSAAAVITIPLLVRLAEILMKA